MTSMMLTMIRTVGQSDDDYVDACDDKRGADDVRAVADV